MSAPESQEEYLETLHRLDNDILDARRKSHEAMHAYRRALQARDAAALRFEMSGHRTTLNEAIRDASETQRRVTAGELPRGDEYTPNKSVIDQTAFYSKGARMGHTAGGGDSFRRGYVDRATGQHVRTVTQRPRTPPRTVSSMRPVER